ncbi:MAG: hypothetical protein KU38_03880 [Sulfurovum sp. FS08-3]|nr:MAG: hypothetical protein KU38_03880 [Sulfurovum sp. FS08-3]
MKKSISLSLAAIASLLVSCGGGGSSASNATPTTPQALFQDVTLQGKAIDGYLKLATICLDLDNNGYCQASSEPTASTDENGSYSLVITKEIQQSSGFANAHLLVFGGTDSDTGKAFEGTLKAPLDMNNTQALFVTPVTTLVAQLMRQGKTKEEALERISKLFDIPKDTLLKDPVAQAKENDHNLLNSALQIQKAIEVLVSKNNQSIEDLLSALGEALEGIDDNVSGWDGVLSQLTLEGKDEAVVLVKNIHTAIQTVSDEKLDERKLARMALSIENFKKGILSGSVSVDANSSAIVEQNFMILDEELEHYYLTNMLENYEDLNLSDEDIEELKNMDLGFGFSQDDFIESVQSSDVASLDFVNRIEEAILAKKEQATLKERLISDGQTLQTLLSGEGVFEFFAYIWNEQSQKYTFEIAKTLFVDGKLVTSSYDNNDSITEDAKHYVSLVLSNGQWISMDEYENAQASFDSNGSLVVTQTSRTVTYSVDSFDLSKLKIAPIASDYWSNIFEPSKTFSEGAKGYKYTVVSNNSTFKPYYQMAYYTDGISDANLNIVNGYTTQSYSSLDEFIKLNSTKEISNHSTWYGFMHTKGEYLSGYIVFGSNNSVSLIQKVWDEQGVESIKEMATGTYTLSTIENQVTLLLNFDNDASNYHTAYLEENGKVVQSYVDENGKLSNYLNQTYRIWDEALGSDRAIASWEEMEQHFSLEKGNTIGLMVNFDGVYDYREFVFENGDLVEVSYANGDKPITDGIATPYRNLTRDNNQTPALYSDETFTLNLSDEEAHDDAPVMDNNQTVEPMPTLYGDDVYPISTEQPDIMPILDTPAPRGTIQKVVNGIVLKRQDREIEGKSMRFYLVSDATLDYFVLANADGAIEQLVYDATSQNIIVHGYPMTYTLDKAMTSIDEFINFYSYDANSANQYGVWLYNGENAFFKDGKLLTKDYATNQPREIGTYEIKSVEGVEILILNPYQVTHYDGAIKQFYTVDSGYLRAGEYYESDLYETYTPNDGLLYNPIAIEDLKDAYIESALNYYRGVNKETKVSKTPQEIKIAKAKMKHDNLIYLKHQKAMIK